MRMFRFPLAVLATILPGIAIAQSQQPYQPTTAVLLRQALECENIASGQYAQSQAKIGELTKQVSDLTKERDDLKAAKPAEPPQ
jgi:hypothetical protein